MYLLPSSPQKRALCIDHPECNSQIGLLHPFVDQQSGFSSTDTQRDFRLASGTQSMSVRRTMVVKIDRNPQFADADDCGHGYYNPSGWVLTGTTRQSLTHRKFREPRIYFKS